MKKGAPKRALKNLKRRKRLVLNDLRNSTHRALLHAVTTGDARVFVHGFGGAVYHLKNLLRARINADTATDAFVRFNDWM